MKRDAEKIIADAIASADPYSNTKKAINEYELPDCIYVAAVGKAACPMAKAVYDAVGDKIRDGIVLTKYNHIDNLPEVFRGYEAGHPVPDENSVKYTEKILEMTEKLGESDTLVFLLSGGASALFEKPLVTLDEMKDVTDKLLKCSAEITEVNAIRKRLSAVKGGKFAAGCRCRIICLVLSDVIGDRLDVIGSGPCFPDKSTSEDVKNIIKKYNLDFGDKINKLLCTELPSEISNVRYSFVGNISMLCSGAEKSAEELGYKTEIVSCSLSGEASEEGRRIALDAIERQKSITSPTALIYGGETTVTIHGKGKGGRNQELALAAAEVLGGHDGIVLFSVGSDGTDGPTDAAGGYVDGSTKNSLSLHLVNIENVLYENDSYNALALCGGLIKTGATGTNVNDLTVVLIN